MNQLYAAGMCLVLAQFLGVYALITRKADLVFALIMIVLLGIAVVMGGMAAYHRVH